MAHSTLESFRKELLTTDGYVTSVENRAPTRRKAGRWTTISFSWAPFSVFPYCALIEAFHCLTTAIWAKLCYACFRKAESFGMTVTLDGWKNRREYEGPVVYVANHMSTLETIMLPPILLSYGPFNVVVKASLSHLPCLERAAFKMGLIPIGRKSPREDLMTLFETGVERIKAGQSVLIFSQGSREPIFARKGFSSIGAKLAEKAGVPLMPVALKTDCEPTRPDGKGWFKDFGTVDTSKDIRFRCGPILTGTAKEMHAASFAWIKEQLEEWQMPTEG